MINNISEAIIIGGGDSIIEGISLGLQTKISNKFVIVCNYAYKHFQHTLLAFMDKNFYVPNSAKTYIISPENRHPDIYEELKSLSLIIGVNNDGISEFKLNNTILLDKKYRTNLTGLFALKLLNLLEFKGNCFLLGFDWSRRINLPEKEQNYNPYSSKNIHYYDLKHKGSGYVGYYENHNPKNDLKQFIKKDVNIYNVSLNSNINCFEKISYKQMFSLLSKETYNQEELRTFVKTTLLP